MKVRVTTECGVGGDGFMPHCKYRGVIYSGEYEVEDDIGELLIESGWAERIGKPPAPKPTPVETHDEKPTLKKQRFTKSEDN